MKIIGQFNKIDVGITNKIMDVKDSSVLVVGESFMEKEIKEIIEENPCVLYITSFHKNVSEFLFDKVLYFQSFIDIKNGHTMTYHDDFFTKDTIYNFFWNAYPSKDKDIKKYMIYYVDENDNIECAIRKFFKTIIV